MFSSVENVLASSLFLWGSLIAFLVSQAWIGWVLGSTGEKLLRLQTVALFHPLSPEGTGQAARRMLQEEWSEVDVVNFHRHFLLDFWIHPLIYGLFLLSALLHDFKIKTRRLVPEKDQQNMVFYARIAAALILVGALCDVLENSRHSQIEFRWNRSQVAPPQLLVEATDRLLWEASVFACPKWAITSTGVAWLTWRYFVSPWHKTEKQS